MKTIVGLERLQVQQGEIVAALIRQAFARTTQPVQPPPSALGVTAADIAAHLLAGGGGVVATPARACLLWRPAADALHVSRLAVATDHRGQGLATAMLLEAEREAYRRGLPRLTLSTRLALEGNRRLFERFGFVETGRSAHPGYTEPTIADFEKKLTWVQALGCAV